MTRLLLFAAIVTIVSACSILQTTSKDGVEVVLFFGNKVKNPNSMPCEKGYPVSRRIPEGETFTDSVRATVEAWLGGPTSDEEADGYFLAVPKPLEIKKWMVGSTAESFGWSDEDTVVSIRRIDFSRDTLFIAFSTSMRAYGGGSCRVGSIVGPLKLTLQQFSQVKHTVFEIQTAIREESFQP